MLPPPPLKSTFDIPSQIRNFVYSHPFGFPSDGALPVLPKSVWECGADIILGGKAHGECMVKRAQAIEFSRTIMDGLGSFSTQPLRPCFNRTISPRIPTTPARQDTSEKYILSCAKRWVEVMTTTVLSRLPHYLRTCIKVTYIGVHPFL